MSPELFEPQRFGFEKIRPTESSDCYVLGMVIYEVVSGHVPFHQHHDLVIPGKVLDGERPPRDAWFTDSLWKMLERCWEPRPAARPNVDEVLRSAGRVQHCSLWRWSRAVPSRPHRPQLQQPINRPATATSPTAVCGTTTPTRTVFHMPMTRDLEEELSKLTGHPVVSP